jgi:hypothetical protein
MRMRVVMAFVAAFAIATAGQANVDAQPAAPAPARQKPPTPPPAPPAQGAAIGPDAPPPPPGPPTPDGRARKVGPNVRVEVTFTEQRSDAPAQPKTVSVTTGDGHWGRVRAQAHSSIFGATPLNVDVRPEVQPDGRVVVALTLEYGDKRVVEPSPQASGPVMVGQPKQVTDVNMNQSVTVVLDSGKPLVITQAADPTGDRKVTVEVKATILR